MKLRPGPLTIRGRLLGIALTVGFALGAGSTGSSAPVVLARSGDAAVIDSLRCCFERPVLALEFPDGAADLNRLLDKTEVRSAFGTSVTNDFIFIAAYTALWLYVAWRVRGGGWLTWLTSAFLLAAATGDVFENRAMLDAVDAASRSQGLTDAAAARISWWAASKWNLLGIAFALLAACVKPRAPIVSGWQVMRGLIAVSYVVAAIICAIAAFGMPWLLERTTLPLALAAVLQLFLFGLGDVEEPSTAAEPNFADAGVRIM